MSAKTFSIITVVRNNAAGFVGTARSVLSQDRNLLEYIVVDGASTDGTLDAIAQFSNHIDQFISEPDKGIYDAMNKAIALAQGEWIHFLNCEDVFNDASTLHNLSKEISSDDDIIFGQCFNINSQAIHRFKPSHLYWAGMTFDHQAAIVRAPIYKNLMYDTQYRINADFDFFSRARKAGHRFREISEIVARKPYQGGASDDLLSRMRERSSIAKRHHPDKPMSDQILLEILNSG